MDSAVTPNTPLRIKYFLLFPNGEIPTFQTTNRLNTNEIILLKRINSVTGYPSNNFTQTCISENANEEINMYFIALFMVYDAKVGKVQSNFETWVWLDTYIC